MASTRSSSEARRASSPPTASMRRNEVAARPDLRAPPARHGERSVRPWRSKIRLIPATALATLPRGAAGRLFSLAGSGEIGEDPPFVSVQGVGRLRAAGGEESYR